MAKLQGELMGYMRRHNLVIVGAEYFPYRYGKTTCTSQWKVHDSRTDTPQAIDPCEMHIVTVELAMPEPRDLTEFGLHYRKTNMRAHRMIINDPDNHPWVVNALPLSAEGEFSAHLLVDDIGHVRGVMHTKDTKDGNEQTLYLN